MSTLVILNRNLRRNAANEPCIGNGMSHFARVDGMRRDVSAPRDGVPNPGGEATARATTDPLAFISGGSLKMGRVIGETDRRGERHVIDIDAAFYILQ